MKNYKITVLKGDGIGPEIVDECVKVLDKASEKFGFSFDYNYQLWADALLMNTVFRILMKQQRLVKHRMLFFSVR